MMISPSGTGALLGCQVVIWVGSSSSTLRRRRRVTLRCEPRGPPPPLAGPPLRLAPAGTPPVGAPGRAALKPPPGREDPPVRGAPVLGRALIGREPLEGPPRLGAPDIGRRAPGGGGIGRPEELIGRPGGGGMGRPEELSGGRDRLSPSDAPPRWVGRIVVGPSGDTLRVGTGFGAGTLERTTLGAMGAATSGSDVSETTSASDEAAGAGVAPGDFVTRDTRVGAASVTGVAGSLTTAFVALTALVVFVALATLTALFAFSAVGTAEGVARRRPSVSARRRMRSAWASSIDAEGLEAPIPSFWASASNSLLVRPSSFESSCTRIFFGAKTFPYITYPNVRRAQLPILSQLQPFPVRETTQRRRVSFGDRGSECPRQVRNAQCPFAVRVIAPPHTAAGASPEVPRSVGVPAGPDHFPVVSLRPTDHTRADRGYASPSETVSTASPSPASPCAVVTTCSTTSASGPTASTTITS